MDSGASMTISHTPGPWYVATGDHQELGLVRAVTTKEGEVDVICIVDKLPSNSEELALANARLIAAAPDLLEALKSALKAMESDWLYIDSERGPTMQEFGDLESAVAQYHPSTDVIRDARAAIAKATGEQQ